jgi:hypothetical protein
MEHEHPLELEEVEGFIEELPEEQHETSEEQDETKEILK